MNDTLKQYVMDHGDQVFVRFTDGGVMAGKALLPESVSHSITTDTAFWFWNQTTDALMLIPLANVRYVTSK